MGVETVSSILKSGVTATELGDPLRLSVGGIPQSVALVIAARSQVVGHSGTLEPLGVIAGMVFVRATRVSYSALLKCFQSVGRWSVSCLLRRLAPCSKGDMSAQKPRPGFDELAQKGSFGD